MTLPTMICCNEVAVPLFIIRCQRFEGQRVIGVSLLAQSLRQYTAYTENTVCDQKRCFASKSVAHGSILVEKRVSMSFRSRRSFALDRTLPKAASNLRYFDLGSY